MRVGQGGPARVAVTSSNEQPGLTLAPPFLLRSALTSRPPTPMPARSAPPSSPWRPRTACTCLCAMLCRPSEAVLPTLAWHKVRLAPQVPAFWWHIDGA